jgi:2-polyprenyl-6-methoxyphenol hydroxylase-like FAD-dependent oxidoreductase
MAPFRGEGGCQAMWDSLNLARAIESMDKTDKSSMKTLLKEYQDEMLQRGREAAELSDKGLDSGVDESSSRVVGGVPIGPLPKETITI